MARTTEIRATIRYTKNLGNYESFSAEASVTVALDLEDNEDGCFSSAWDQVKNEVRKQVESVRKEK